MTATYNNGQWDFHFNDHVCAEMMIGVPDEKRTGRLVQVRKGAGAFGTDLYLLRLRDGSLMAFSNVLIRHADDQKFIDAFYLSNGSTPPEIPHQEIEEADSETVAYSIENKWHEVGFVIEKPMQPESPIQSFAMTIIEPA